MVQSDLQQLFYIFSALDPHPRTFFGGIDMHTKYAFQGNGMEGSDETEHCVVCETLWLRKKEVSADASASVAVFWKRAKWGGERLLLAVAVR